MTLMDEEEQRWYCYDDDLAFFGREQRWNNGTSGATAIPRPTKLKYEADKPFTLWNLAGIFLWISDLVLIGVFFMVGLWIASIMLFILTVCVLMATREKKRK